MNKNFQAACCALFLGLALGGAAAESDTGKFLPKVEPFSADNLFLEFSGNLVFPLGFVQQQLKPMTNLGGSVSVGVGYNWQGWLFGAYYTHDRWWPGRKTESLFGNFRHNVVEARVQKVLSSNLIRNFPDWLALVPGLGIGVNFIEGDYYKSQAAKAAGRVTRLKAFDPNTAVLFYDASVEASFHVLEDMLIPYVGTSFNAYFDDSLSKGFAGYWRLHLGFRSYPATFPKGLAAVREKRASVNSAR